MRFKDESPWNDRKEEKLLRNIFLMKKELNKGNTAQHGIEGDIQRFIEANRDWVEEDVASKASRGDDRAITKALHHRSI